MGPGATAVLGVERQLEVVAVVVTAVAPGRVAGADAGAHDVRLAAALHLLAHPFPHPLDVARPVLGHDERRDRGTAGGQLGQRRHVEVPEDGHGDRARDRGGRHDEHVRR